jgi:hypothetical protein
MNRKQCLDAAATCVLQNRAQVYAKPEDAFGLIAKLWTTYLSECGPLLATHDVAAMLALMKLARIAQNSDHVDSWVDLAGYAACGVECATAGQIAEDLVVHDEPAELEGWAVK